MKIVTFIIALGALILLQGRGIAQSVYNIWHFGQGFSLDFRAGAPVLRPGSAIWTAEGSASICDPATGAILFYTDGVVVYDRFNVPMPNGVGLSGHVSSTQAALIVPMPGDPNRYYIFNTDQEGYAQPHRGAFYSVVDMAVNNGRGDVTLKNVQLQAQCAEKLTAVPHANGTDYWVILHSLGGNSFYAYQVGRGGVGAVPVVSAVGVSQTSPPGPTIWTVGYMKASPSGRRLALACEGPGLVELFDFNPCSGAVTNPIQLEGTPRNAPYGITFSPDNSKLYVAATRKLVQFNLARYDSASIVGSRTLLNDPANANGAEVGGAMQIGPDGKVYVVANSNWIGVINRPDSVGNACNYVSRSINPTNVFGAFWLGLPNNIDAGRNPGGISGIDITPRGPIDLCQGGSIVLTAPAGYRSYQWSTGDTTVAITARLAGTYTVMVGDSGGCTALGTVEVRLHPLPRVRITATGPAAFCNGDSLQLIASPGFRSYQWSTGAVAAAIIVRASGRYRVEVTDSLGCRGTDSIDVLVRPNPQPKIVGPAVFCHGGFTRLDAGPGYARYRWTTGDTTRTIVVGVSATVQVSVVDTFGCVGLSAPFTVVRRPPVDASITSIRPLAFCDGDSTVLVAAAGFRSYRWSTGATSPAISVTVGGPYTLAVVDTNGCSDSSTINVVVYPRPVPVISYDRPIGFCAGDSVELDAGDGHAAYLWSTGQRTRRIVVREEGSYRVAVTSMHGCEAISEPVEVKVFPRPNAALNGPTTICPNTNASYSLPTDANWTYSWTVVGGVLASGAGTHTIVVHWGASGTGEVHVVVASTAGCADTATLIVVVGTELVPTITSDRSLWLCAGDSVTLDAGIYRSYRWSTGDTTRRIRVTNAGDYTVSVVDSGGCFGTSKPVTVRVAAQPEPRIQALDGTVLCEGDSATLDAGDGFTLDAGDGFTEYRWSSGERTRRITVWRAGAYSVDVTDSSGCRGTSLPVVITVNTAPAIDIVGPGIVCRGSALTYQAVGGDTGRFSFTWSVDGGAIGSGNGSRTVVVNWGDGPIGTVMVAVTDLAGGCPAAQRLGVVVGDSVRPKITPSDSTAFCAGGSVTLDAGGGYARYRWSTDDTTRSIVVADSGSYTITVASAEGCEGSARAEVRVASPPTPRLNPGGLVTLCQGDSLVLDAPAGYRLYRWSTGERTRAITVHITGEYRVEVEDSSGCVGTSPPTTVFVNPPPAVPIITRAGRDLISSPAAAYQWQRNDSLLAGATSRVVGEVSAGIYRVAITDSNGCSSLSDPFVFGAGHVVWLDTVRAEVGQRVRLLLRIEPALAAADSVRDFSLSIGVPPLALYTHCAGTPGVPATGEADSVRMTSRGRFKITRPGSGNALAGAVLAWIEVEGLASGQTLNPVTVDSITIGTNQDVRVAGPGLVILSGCAIGRAETFIKGVQILSVAPVPTRDRVTLRYVASAGASATLTLIGAGGTAVDTWALTVAPGVEQAASVDLAHVPSGTYFLELRDAGGRSTLPIVIRR